MGECHLISKGLAAPLELFGLAVSSANHFEAAREEGHCNLPAHGNALQPVTPSC
jgi:hypothetical protein